jgi:hypothetical protein
MDRCVFCNTIREEIVTGDRLIHVTPHFAAFAPYATPGAVRGQDPARPPASRTSPRPKSSITLHTSSDLRGGDGGSPVRGD